MRRSRAHELAAERLTADRTASDLFSAAFARIVNDLPRLVFTTCDPKRAVTVLASPLFQERRSARRNRVQRERFLIRDVDNAAQSLRLDDPLSS
jgi:hypothetical protein